VTPASIRDYIATLRSRYAVASCALKHHILDELCEREPGADDLAAALREAAPIRRSHAERLDQARRSLRGLEKPTIRPDRSSCSTTAAPELGLRLFDLN
jgi:hypothetical protein